MTSDLVCLGDDDTVEEGRKSFPSGHTGCETKWEGREDGEVLMSVFSRGVLLCRIPDSLFEW